MLLDGEPKILVDHPIVDMLGPARIDEMRSLESAYQTPGARALRAHVLLRSRFAEDRLAESVRRGIRQYVILGAGNDTFAYRQPEWAAAVHVVEVDHPASQEGKRERLAAAGISVPPNVTFAPVDFEHVSLRDALTANGVDLSAPVFFSWLGVTMYLTEAAVDAVLRTVAALPPSSEIAFTFARRDPPDAVAERDGPTLAERAAALGEPWLSYFEPDELDAKLRSFGFSNIYFLTPASARERYFQGRSDGLDTPRRTSIVSAIV